MYTSPKLEKFGTFRQVTLGGGAAANDTFTIDTTDNCESRTVLADGTIRNVCLES